VAVYEALVKIVFAISKACYIDNKPIFRILCGSIYLMLGCEVKCNTPRTLPEKVVLRWNRRMAHQDKITTSCGYKKKGI